MIKFTLSSALLVTMLGGSLGIIAGCGEAEVPKADVEQTAMKQLTATVGKPSPQITCPGNLKAKTGTTMTCKMDLDGKPHDVLISVTGVEGSTAKFDVEVK